MSALTSALVAIMALPGAVAQTPENRTPPADRFAALISEADADGDGAITREEYDLARARSFDRLDGDGDGFLDPSERPDPQVLERLGATPDPRLQMAARAIGRGREQASPPGDVDGDGRVSRSEFLAMPAAGFERIDQNADGVLSADELAAAQDRPARRLRRTP